MSASAMESVFCVKFVVTELLESTMVSGTLYS